ncbi:hypothetical protein J4434_01050 [Candidatus Woesearchaeota archaeon]|nr:hypothetical protein [Candidatus Woesearchaeota archaeon]
MNKEKEYETDKRTKFDRRRLLQVAGLSGLSTLVLSVVGCGSKKNVCPKDSELTGFLKKNYFPSNGTREIDPKGYIDWLKESVFTHGELDNLPKCGIILHDAKVEQHLQKLGFNASQYKIIETGSTDPNLIYIVRKNFGKDFILNRGLPGAGGVATQAAELYALGVEHIIHIGTCGLIGEKQKEGTPIISSGSYKDAAALILSAPEQNAYDNTLIARPSEELTKKISETFNIEHRIYSLAIGFTMPIYYFQPTAVIEELINGEFYSYKPRPSYVEMEAASLFMTAKLMGKHAASLVIGSDRYILSEGKLKHEFYDVDSDTAKSQLIEAALKTFDKM